MNRRCFLHAGNGSKSRQQLIEEGDLLRFLFVPEIGQRQLERQSFGGVESWIDRRQLDEAADEEAGTCKQHDRKGHFPYDQRAPQARATTSRQRPAPRLFQRASEGGRRSVQRRNDAKDKPGQNRQ